MKKLDEFVKSIEKGISLVDLNAPWCGPCRSQEPIIKKINEKYKGRANVLEVNIDKSRELAFKLNVQSIPTLIIFKDGEEIERFVGLQSEKDLCKSLDTVL